MIQITSNSNNTYFTLNGKRYLRIYQPIALGTESIGIYNIFDTRFQILGATAFNEIQINDTTYNSRDALISALISILYSIEAGGVLPLTGAEIKTAYEGEPNTNAFTDIEKSKLSGIEDNATADQTGAEIKTAYEAEPDTNAFTDTDKTKLDGIESGATADMTGAEIKTAYEAEPDTNAYTNSEKTKLGGIEDGATTDQTGAEIKSLYEAEPNAFTDADRTKIDGIESGATADQTSSEIKTAYESNADTNAYTDSEKTKLTGIEDGATADQTGAEIKTAYEAEADTNAFTDAEKTKLAGIEDGATAGGGGTATITAESIQEAMGYFLDPTSDEFVWNTGNSQTFNLTKELVHLIRIDVNGQVLKSTQYTIAVDNLSITITDTLQDTDTVNVIYLRKYVPPVTFEQETIDYMTATGTPDDDTVVHNSLTGSQVWSKMDELIKRAKGDGSWVALKSWHPMFGGTAAKHAYNVVDTTAHPMTFNGSWTIDANGNRGGGATADYATFTTNPAATLTGDNGGWTIAFNDLVNQTAYILGATDESGTTERFGNITLSGNLQADFNDSTSYKVLGAIVPKGTATNGMWNDTSIGLYNGTETVNAAQTKPSLSFASDTPYYGSRYRQSVGGADNPSTSQLTSIAFHDGDPTLLPLIHQLIIDWETFLGRQ